MRPRTALFVSLGLNAALVAALMVAIYRPLDIGRDDAPAVSTAPPQELVYKTNVVVRRENFTWQELESEDFPTYIANLRAIGCPEQTIRDIIVAEVDALYERRKATEVVTPEQQWWRLEPDRELIEAVQAQFAALESERRALLTQLLGPHWDPSHSAQLAELHFRFDGPVLGSLSPEVKRAILDLELEAAQRRQAYLQSVQVEGTQPDVAVLAKYRQETRQRLAQLLNPSQLEEYLLRYSSTAQILRTNLHGLELTPDEFRALFRSRDAVEQESSTLAGNDPASTSRRQALAQETEQTFRQTLGPERYVLFRYLQDPIFRQAQASAQQLGIPADKVLPIYQVNQAALIERERISNDASLTLEQRAAALASMISQQQQTLRALLGDEAFQLYLQTARP